MSADVARLKAKHIRQLRILSLASWLLSALLIYLASFLPLFDSSPFLLVEKSSWTSPLLRWDAFHFGPVAQAGYVYEYQWAFFPGAPFVMRSIATLFDAAGLADSTSWSTLLGAGALACCFTSSTVILYELTLHHTMSPTASYLAALLSLLPTSPVTLRFVAYSEPFFTYLSYYGMLCCARTQWFWATCCFALAGTFRSNGLFLSGFILWGLLIEPVLSNWKISLVSMLKAVLYSAVTFVPFVSHQYAAYAAFCTASIDTPALWCSNFPPSIYTYIQAKYWNSGFLQYWTPSQIPNFLMCAPILALLLWFTTTYIQLSLIPRFIAFTSAHSTRPSKTNGAKSDGQFSSSPFMTKSLNPHVIHTFILTLIYIFASNTQIILRQAAAMPTTYWAAAYLLMEKPMLGRWWVGWSIVWGAVSIVLWTTFLPPA